MQSSAKTGWVHIFFVVVLTLGAIYYIKQSLDDSIIQWQVVNEVRAVEIQQALEE